MLLKSLYLHGFQFSYCIFKNSLVSIPFLFGHYLKLVLSLNCRGVPPSPRSDHAAAVHADRYVLIFGGGSHATCFNDLHVLDLQNVRVSCSVVFSFFYIFDSIQ